MERKTQEVFETKVIDEDKGIITTIFSVMGIIDHGKDVVHPGSFTKTFAERGHKVRVLDGHRHQSVLNVLGKPIAFRELSRAELPAALLEKHPEATGGAMAEIQFLLDTPEGKGAFTRLKAGAVDEWSFMYDALDKDFSKMDIGGKPETVRNLRTIKLYEVSPVIWGMNPATQTLSAKDAGGSPTEGKPWDVFKADEGDVWHVFKVDGDGEPVGASLGSHGSEEEAQAQVRALYANEPKAGGKAEDTEPQHPLSMTETWPLPSGKEMTDYGPMARLGDVLQGSIHKTFTMLCDGWYIEGYLDREERITLSSLIGDALGLLAEGIDVGVAERQVSPYAIMGRSLGDESKAGPMEESPTSDVDRLLADIGIEQERLKLLEV